ncbi:MAG: ATP synthase F0 subunit B [Clostridia bacterium]|nr:ATP synthase F0 subunit B [Clostridia bacterium]
MNVPLNIDWQQILLHLLNFAILFAILYFLLYNPVKSFMDKRCEYYKNLDDEAMKNFQESENAKKVYTEKLKSVDSEIEQKRQAAYASLSENNERMILAAKQQAEKIIADANEKAENDRSKIIKNAQSEVADIVTAATEKLVLQSSTAESYEQFLTAVERGGNDE